MYEFINNIFIYEFIYEFRYEFIILVFIYMKSYMNSVVRILWRDTSWYTLNHMFFSWIQIWIYGFSWIHIWIHIFHEFIYELWYEFFDGTLLGAPDFMIFHEFMPDIKNFGHFSWKKSYWKSYLKNIVNNIVKNIVNWWDFSVTSGHCIVNSCMKCIPAALRAAAPCLMGPTHEQLRLSHLPHCQPICSAEQQCQYPLRTGYMHCF